MGMYLFSVILENLFTKHVLILVGNSQNKNENKTSCNTSVKSTNARIQQCNTIQPFNSPIRSFNIPVQSSCNNTLLPSYNASIISSIKPPKQFESEEEFFQTWSSWKSDFLIFRRIIDCDKLDNKMCGNLLLNIMGPIGQEILKKFNFNSLNDKNNLDTLLNKFDEYYTIAPIKKPNKVDTFMYISQLQLKMEKANIANVEELIKNKILKEIDERMFTNTAKRMLPSFKFSSDFNNLTLKEIAFIWKLYDHRQFCDRCGDIHSDVNCPAMRQQCTKCKEWNHLHKRCPLVFVHNCKYCGNSHLKKRCPAYNEICTKCGKLNHFSWTCLSTQILQCKFCGLTHAASRSLCPARNTVCTRCKTTGHFAAKCEKNSYSKNH